jgi:hypothetical protein
MQTGHPKQKCIPNQLKYLECDLARLDTTSRKAIDRNEHLSHISKEESSNQCFNLIVIVVRPATERYHLIQE